MGASSAGWHLICSDVAAREDPVVVRLDAVEGVKPYAQSAFLGIRELAAGASQKVIEEGQ